jgi:hypothetical protein
MAAAEPAQQVSCGPTITVHCGFDQSHKPQGPAMLTPHHITTGVTLHCHSTQDLRTGRGTPNSARLLLISCKLTRGRLLPHS